ncbi:MAG TPA: sugar phosphate isomerase/epimerase [Chloroflexota bacterium]|nr:sugar phosphate isomerase/epimerase [Chloroflexota bacterium]
MDFAFPATIGPGNWQLDDLAAWARNHEFDGIRLVGREEADPEVILRDGPDRILGSLKKHGLYVSAYNAHTALLHADPVQAEQNALRLHHCIDAAALLGAPVVITNTGSPYSWHFYGTPSIPSGNPTDKVDEVIALFRECFTPAVRHAEEKGVQIGLDTAVRMGNIACNPEMWERCLDAVPSDALGLSCDPSHLLWLHITPPEDAIRMFKGKWVYADLKDCEVSPQMLFRQGIIGNWWWHYRIPGRGQLSWGTIIGALNYAGYQYVLDVENEDRELPGPEGIALGRRYLSQFVPPD